MTEVLPSGRVRACTSPAAVHVVARVEALLAFVEQHPTRCCHRGRSVFPAVFVLLFIALLLPHQTGTGALDVLHMGAEHAFNYVLWR